MAPFPYPNETASTVVGLLQYNNDVTNGYFGFLILLTIFMISFIGLKSFEANKALTASAFLVAMLGFLFRLMGILTDKFLWLPFVLLGIGVIWLQFES